MFHLVGDVEAYPQFVPWVTAMRVWNQREDEAGGQLDAEVAVGFSFLTERFSTHVRRDRARREIAVSLLQGPFKHLLNRWRFSDDPLGCKIEFIIDFEFKSRTLERVLSANLEKAIERLIGCFEARARALYG